MPKPAIALMIGAKGGDKEEMGESKGSFPAPKGMDMEGKKPGETIEVVCELEVEDGGTLCVKKVNGMEVPGYEEKSNPADKEDSYKDGFTDAVMPEGGQNTEGGMQGGDEEQGAM